MSTPDSSLSLRNHLDAVIGPAHEQLFALLDLLLVVRHRPQSCTVDTDQLEAAFSEGLSRLDERHSVGPDTPRAH